MKRLMLLLAVIFGVYHAQAQLQTVQFEQLDSLQKRNDRPVVIFIYTDWCKYCEAMKNTTLKTGKIISLINNSYYFVDFNAETKKDIKVDEHVFKYKSSGNNTGIHELAEQLGTINSEISYPTLCVLNRKNEIIFQYNQFISALDLYTILKKLSH